MSAPRITFAAAIHNLKCFRAFVCRRAKNRPIDQIKLLAVSAAHSTLVAVIADGATIDKPTCRHLVQLRGKLLADLGIRLPVGFDDEWLPERRAILRCPCRELLP